MPGEVAFSKLSYNALAVRRAFPTIVYIKASVHHVTFEELSACTSAVHAESNATHTVKFVRDMSNLVGSL